MKNAGNRPASAGSDIGSRPRDRARDANAAELHRGNVCNTLRAQFAVRPMAASGHAIGDYGGQKRFDSAEQCYCDGIRQHRLNFFEAEKRQAWSRKRTGNRPEAGVHGGNVEVKPGAYGLPRLPPRSGTTANLGADVESDDQSHGHEGNSNRRKVNRRQRVSERRQLWQQR